MSGIERIAAERERQVSAEGWTPEHDTQHGPYDLLRAADCYVKAAFASVPNPGQERAIIRMLAKHGIDPEADEDFQRMRANRARHHFGWDDVPDGWPWEREAWKPSPGRIRNLEKAGALIAAEIDRLLAVGLTQ